MPASPGRPASLAELRATIRSDAARAILPADRRILALFRIGQYAHQTRNRLLQRVHRRADALWVRGLAGAELPPELRCGPGLLIHHAARGVVIHPDVVLGRDANIYHGVTIGQRGPGRPPIIGDRVYIGTGAVVLGPITIGDDVSIGANAVVLRDAPSGSTLAGVPAQIVRGGADERAGH